MRQHRRSLSIVALMAVASVASILVWLNQSRADRLDLMRAYIGTLNEIVGKAERNYYKDVDEQKMLEGAIRGAVAALNDPYSFYQSPEEQQREQEELFYAEFGGLGIRIYPEQQGEQAVVKIWAILPDSPAMRANLHSGDAIIRVDGESILLGGSGGLTLNDVVTKLRGPVGEPVTITVVRRNRLEPFDVTLVRDVIKFKSVRSTVVEPGIGYVSIDSFTSQTMEEFQTALESIQTATELHSLIVDLRDNRGGLLTAAKGVSDAFLNHGTIVYTKGRRAEFDHTYSADRQVLIPNSVEIVVLVNGNSASGSEIVAGALKDLQRGILVGTKTFGKGVVQQRFPLRNGGAVSLTTSSYYTPSGTSIDGEGIQPNVEVAADRLSDEEAFAREEVRDAQTIETYVIDFIKNYEKENGAPPKDASLLKAHLPEIVQRVEEAGFHLKPKTIWLEARNVFDLNVGIQRLLDLENDAQLREALRLIKNGAVAKVLDGTYHASAQEPAVLN